MEIGSEFEWNNIVEEDGILDWLPQGLDSVFTFSGRTAIEVALKNISKKRKALIPSYCCDSMIVPFRDFNISYDFYQVTKSEYGISIGIEEESLMDVDILFICNYFGFNIQFPDELIKKFKNKGGTVIEDITHSFLSDNVFHSYSDYLVGSLRKWGDLLDGGYCCSRNVSIAIKPEKKPDKSYISNKTNAMKLKKAYLSGDKIKKNIFLDIYEKCNRFLSDNYSDTLMSISSNVRLSQWNIPEIRKKRRENSRELLSAINHIEWIKTVFDVEQMDCPLFVPILIEKDKRDYVRKKLIQNDIYCPIHWQHPKEVCKSELYDMELSLICDQRYGYSDMQRIISVLKKC